MTVRATCAAIALMLMASAGYAQPASNVATLERSAVVPLAPQALAARVRFLDIEITAYTPPQDGAVQAIVSTTDRGKSVELGRFGIYGGRFDTAAGGTPQRFRLTLPDGYVPGGAIVVRLEPSAGSARGATMVIGQGTFGN